MAKKSKEYWIERFNRLQETELGKADRYVESLDVIYQKAIRAVENDIRTWYSRFAENEQIDLVEANKRLIGKELKELHWTVEEYIQAGKENAIDQRWMKQLENASARVHVTRLESLKLQMQQHIEVIYGNQLDEMDKLMGGLYQDRYYKTAYETQLGFNTGWAINAINQELIEAVLKKPWAPDGLDFSARVWRNRDVLVSTLHTELTQAIIRGDNPAKIIKTIADKMNVSKRAAGRLVMTEAAFFASAGQKKAYEDLDVEMFEFVATLDLKTSDKCREADTWEPLPMSEFKVGVTAPPLHVFCRSTTVPFFPDNYTERAARNADGKVYYVPGDLKYKDWYETYVKED